MSLDEFFNEAAERVRNFKKKPGDKDLLELYALYKQSTVGDCNTNTPADARGDQKWKAWDSKRGLEADIAKRTYIDRARTLQQEYA